MKKGKPVSGRNIIRMRLDRYHIYQEILRKIGDKEAQSEIRRLFDEEKIGEIS